LKKEDFLSFYIFWQGNEPRNFVLQNPVTRQDSLGKFLCNALLFTLCLGTIFPKKQNFLPIIIGIKKRAAAHNDF